MAQSKYKLAIQELKALGWTFTLIGRAGYIHAITPRNESVRGNVLDFRAEATPAQNPGLSLTLVADKDWTVS
jgi:hypothetical protein